MKTRIKSKLVKLRKIIFFEKCYHRFSLEDMMSSDNPRCMYCGITKTEIMAIEKI